jgi:hypothetical protein
MAGLVPAIHVDPRQRGIRLAAHVAAADDKLTFRWTAWIPRTSPGMTGGYAEVL